MMLYRLATLALRPWATEAARDRPLAPGPPGLTSRSPSCWLAGALAGTSVRASVIFRPAGSLDFRRRERLPPLRVAPRPPAILQLCHFPAPPPPPLKVPVEPLAEAPPPVLP